MKFSKFVWLPYITGAIAGSLISCGFALTGLIVLALAFLVLEIIWQRKDDDAQRK